MSVVGGGANYGGSDVTLSDQTGEFTGRYLVVFSDEVHGDAQAIAEAMQSVAGVSSMASSLDFEEGALDPDVTEADATVFAELGVAVMDAEPSEGGAISALDADPRVLAVEPERILYAIEDPPVPLEYVRGYRDGVSHLYEQLTGGLEAEVEAGIAALFNDDASSTWGLQAARASTSTRTGGGIRVAILDTGFDLDHPDFAGRPVLSRSFISGQAVQDAHGHGTHCVGTSCGPKTPPGGSRRYGVATNSEILVGKVLSNQGSGSDTSILAGIDWALRNGAQVISMSLGANVRQVSRAYERVGQRALQAGSLIIAAAGNNANRAVRNFGFVGIPANSPSIMAVAAVDANLRIANFSARSNPVAGGKVDIAGPGVGVYSSWPMPRRYNTISGTSMATPHVSGVAALISQATGARGAQLWTRLTQTARPLNIPTVDVGAGLVQAPQ